MSDDIRLHRDERGDDWLTCEPSATSVIMRPSFGTMGVDEDPDAYDRLRDEGYFDDYRYSGKEPWQ